MTIPEPTTIDELIEDCASIPRALMPDVPALPGPRAAAPWVLDAATAETVQDLDVYV